MDKIIGLKNTHFLICMCGPWPKLIRLQVHFKEDVRRQFAKDPTSTTCAVCDAKFASRRSLFYHAATFHDAVKSKIPTREESRRTSLSSAYPAKNFACQGSILRNSI
jgi:hypothetical protein